MPKGRKNCPKVPPIKPMGKNTATIVRVEIEAVKPISRVAENAASRGLSPSSRWRIMFSTSTIASSTIMPIAKANASKVRVSKLNPATAMTIKVPSKDTGMAIAVIKVALKLRRKGNITKIANATALSRVSIVDFVASRI